MLPEASRRPVVVWTAYCVVGSSSALGVKVIWLPEAATVPAIGVEPGPVSVTVAEVAEAGSTACGWRSA